MSSIEFSISDVLGRAWESAKKHGLVIALFYLVAGMAGELISQPLMYSLSIKSWMSDPTRQLTPEECLGLLSSYMAVSPLLILVQSVLQTGLQNMLLMVFRGGQPDIFAFKLPLRTYGYFILVSFLMGIIVYVGILCCVIPGVWLAVRLSYAPLWVLDHPDCTLEDALKGSWRMTRGHFWNLLGLRICSALIAFSGLFICCIGFYFTSVISGFAFIISYEILKPVLGGGDSEMRFRSSAPDVVPSVAPETATSKNQAPASEECVGKTSFSGEETVQEGMSDAENIDDVPATVSGDGSPVGERPETVAPDGLCDVVLLNAGGDPEAVRRVIMTSVYGKGADEVRALPDAVPVVLMEKVSVSQAERLKAALEEAGAQADIRKSV